jgi:peptidyl-Lys metalloendopeptidase
MRLQAKIGFGTIYVSILVGLSLGYMGIAQATAQEGKIQLLSSDQLVVHVTPFRPEIGRQDSPAIIFRVQNKTKSVVRLLKWGTPIDIGKSKPLRITKDKRTVAYFGVIALRGKPTSTDFIEIQPNETYASAIALDRYYDFSEQGLYTIEWDTVLYCSLGTKLITKIEHYLPVQQKVVILAKEARPKRAPSAEQKRIINRLLEPSKKSATEGCSDNHARTLDIAQSQAALLATQEERELRANSNHNAPEYVEWFGIWDSYRYPHVQHTYGSIANVINGPELSLNCGGDECTPDIIAYVYDTWSFLFWDSGPIRDVYFCRYYWTLDAQTQAGVIIHEAAHITGAEDYAYCWDETDCWNLASNFPNKAVENADSYRSCVQHGSGWGPQPDVCASINDCPNGQFCIHDPFFGGKHCVQGPFRCNRNEDCGEGAACVSMHFMMTSAGQPGGSPSSSSQKYCVLY